MPITPFHFGVGAALHAASPRHASFLAFCIANCITDCETVYNVFWGGYPLHRFLHTFLGASLVAGMTSTLFLAARSVAPRWDLPNHFGWRDLSLHAVALGAVLGTYSHVVLDGIMHADVRPFGPWNDANPFYAAISLGMLHGGCVLAGLLGVAIIWWRNWRQERQ